jgi:hypothetical protein
MKKIQKYMIIALMGAVATIFAGCQKEEPLAADDFSQDYDIPWVVSTITNVTPLEARAGEEITITGTNLGTDWVAPSVMGYFCITPEMCFPTGIESSGVTIGTSLCEIVSQTATQIVIKAPGFPTTRPVKVSVINYHNRTFAYKDPFTPVL